MSTYLNTNIRRTLVKENRFFLETIFLDRLYLRCCRKDIVRACRSNVPGQPNDVIGHGGFQEQMDFHGLRFTWSDQSKEWAFPGPFYEIVLKPTCRREDASAWLDGLFAAEESSGFLHNGPRFVHVLGVEDRAEEGQVCFYNDHWVLWRNLDTRLFAVRLVEVTTGTAEAIEMWKMIMYWTVTVPFMRLR
jgi:hypothetical protein